MSLIPELSCRNCRPHAPFAQLKGLRRDDVQLPKLYVVGSLPIACATILATRTITASQRPSLPKTVSNG